MAVLKRRARLVTFRLSNEEYEAVRETCVASGSRSISEFARSAVLLRARMLSAPQGLLAEDLATLSRELADLDNVMGALQARIRQMLGFVSKEEDKKQA